MNSEWSFGLLESPYSKGPRPFPRPEGRFACRPKKIPAARNTAEMTAFVRPSRKLPRRIASAAFRNQTAAPRYQIQLKLRLTFFL